MLYYIVQVVPEMDFKAILVGENTLISFGRTPFNLSGVCLGQDKGILLEVNKMRGKLEYLFPRLHAGDVLIDKKGASWVVDSWSGTLHLNLIPPKEYGLRMMHMELGFFGNEEDTCLVCVETGAALGAFLGLPEIEVLVADTRPGSEKQTDSPFEWMGETDG